MTIFIVALSTAFVGILIGFLFTRNLLTNRHHQEILTLQSQIAELNENFHHSKQQEESFHNKIEAFKQRAQEFLSQAFYQGGDAAEQTASALNEIKDMIASTQTLAEKLESCGHDALCKADDSRSSMEDLKDTSSHLTHINQKLIDLHKLMETIEEKSSMINKIAAQAELLSFNAAIEAARAGEAGRGFAVVAEDVKRLANISAESANGINDIVLRGMKDVSEISEDVHGKLKRTSHVSEQVLSCYETIHEKLGVISEVSSDLSSWSNNMTEQVVAVNNQSTTSLESISGLLSQAIGIVTETEIVDLECRDAASRLDEFTLIDVRRPDEYRGELGHIQNSRLHCLQDNFKESLKTYEKDKPYLFICRSGGRSARAARIAMVEGFNRVFNLKGGMLEWNKQGLPVEREHS